MNALLQIFGFLQIENLVPASDCRDLVRSLHPLLASGHAGIRHLIDYPAIQRFSRYEKLRSLIGAELGAEAFAFKATLFEKHPQSNWLVAWHQDRTIPVQEKIKMADWSCWSQKEGVHYVNPPPDVMRRILAVRVHLDDCGPGDGPLRVLPASHQNGFLSSAQLHDLTSNTDAISCLGRAGDAMLMCPLLVHASSKSMVSSISKRRVLHLEYANVDLPYGLEWHRRVPVFV